MRLKPIEGPQVEWKARDEVTTRVTAAALKTITGRSLGEAMADPNEKLVGENNLRSISFLELGIQLSKPVAHITLPGRGMATGFLVDVDVLMTNNHVFEQASDAADAIIRFNFQRDLSGNLLPTEEYKCNPENFFHTNPDLDYSVVRLKGEPGFKWGYIRIPKTPTVKVGEDVIIIQHPGGMPKQIGITDNEVMYVGDNFIQYLTDTMPGSSGSPVFDDSWRLVAVHHSGGWIPEPSTGSTHFRNEGFRISAISNDLPSGG